MQPGDKKKPLIGITMGDPTGVGPEVIVKALSEGNISSLCRPVVFGDMRILQREIDNLGISLELRIIDTIEQARQPRDGVAVYAPSDLDPARTAYGRPSAETGRAMASYIVEAVAMAKKEQIDAVVTGPINKQSLHEAGFDYPGHTEMLAALTGTRDVVMMLAGEKLRVVLVTIHCAVNQVPGLLTTEAIYTTIDITGRSLEKYFSRAAPRLAVAALNPHAGEGGLFGNEEQEIIVPAIKKAQGAGINASGPYPPDTLFYQAVKGDFDAVVCMYHDQGLIPLKLLHFEDGVNITLGLPIIRTSVDHGTAYDIAGRGIANPASMLNAVTTAVQMAENRQ